MARHRLSTRERVRCFDDAGGLCHICLTKIQAGQRWEVSHPIPLEAGGDDVPENRRPAHYACHRTVTAEQDIPMIAKIKRILAKHIGAFRPKSRWPSRPFSRKSEVRT